MEKSTQNRRPRTPLNWLGIFFAFAANMLVITVAGYLVDALIPTNRFAQPLIMISALLAGVATAYYVKSRGSMHAFIGGLISIPFLALISFDGAWQPAIVAGALCGMGGALGDLFRGKD